VAVPVSIDTQFRQLNKRLKDLREAGRNTSVDEEEVLVADICNSTLLVLDKAMNAVWKSVVDDRNPGARSKPNVYFPVCVSRERLLKRLEPMQMLDLPDIKPGLFDLIESVQEYNGELWLKSLYGIAQVRHERYPAVERREEHGWALGRDQDVYIEHMTINNGQVNFRGHGINRETGQSEPARFELIREVRSVLEDVGEDPHEFCSSILQKAKVLASKMYSHL